MKRALRFGVLVLVVLAFVACATFTKDAYRTLTVSYQTYDITLSTMGDLFREGKITEAQKTKAITLGRAYKIAHNGAVVALAKYEEQGGDANKNAYIIAASDAVSTLTQLLAYCRPLVEKGAKP